MRIGIDLGGTNIAAGAVGDDGRLLSKVKLPTLPGRGNAAVVRDMARAAGMAADGAGLSLSGVRSVGAGTPGSVDGAAGEVFFSGNLGFSRFPLAAALESELGLPVFIGNDADSAALGESLFGAGKGFGSLVLITLGTGVGGGIVIGGRIYGGANGAAGEIGHMVIERGGAPCTCGRAGCFEAYASATALVRMTREEMDSNPGGGLLGELARGEGGICARTAFRAARRGDEAGERVVARYLSYLACGIANVINLIRPEVVCLGGGVAGEGNYLLGRLRPAVEDETFRAGGRRTELRLAALGNDAGIIGAAMLGAV